MKMTHAAWNASSASAIFRGSSRLPAVSQKVAAKRSHAGSQPASLAGVTVEICNQMGKPTPSHAASPPQRRSPAYSRVSEIVPILGIDDSAALRPAA